MLALLDNGAVIHNDDDNNNDNIFFSIIKAPARVAGQRRCNYCYFELFSLFLFD